MLAHSLEAGQMVQRGLKARIVSSTPPQRR